MKNYLFIVLAFAAFLTGCIQDDIIEDFVEPTIRITTIPDTLELNTSFQFESVYFNNIGVEEDVDVQWQSSDPSIIEINNTGLATAQAIGSAEISVAFNGGEREVEELIDVYVGESTVIQEIGKSGTIQTTSPYLLEGNFEINQDGENLIIDIAEDYRASTALPGLYVYLTNNRNTTSNALEIGAVEVFNGAHSYTVEDVDINDYKFLLYFCKPFNVKVGDAEIN